MTTYLLLTIEHSKPIPELPDLVAGRVWSLDGVETSEAKIIDKQESVDKFFDNL
jgi:hypothetical protein